MNVTASPGRPRRRSAAVDEVDLGRPAKAGSVPAARRALSSALRTASTLVRSASVSVRDGEIADPHQQRGGRAVQASARAADRLNDPGGDGRRSGVETQLARARGIGGGRLDHDRRAAQRHGVDGRGDRVGGGVADEDRAPQPNVVDAQPDAGLVGVAGDRAPDLDRVVVVARAAAAAAIPPIRRWG